MDAALGLGGGHALHAVGTGLELEMAVHAVTGDEADDFLVAAASEGDSLMISTFQPLISA